MEDIKKLHRHIKNYLETLIANINFDKKKPKETDTINRFLGKISNATNFIGDDNTVDNSSIGDKTAQQASIEQSINKFTCYEKAMGWAKVIIKILNKENIDTYEKFSSLSNNLLFDIKGKLAKINAMFVSIEEIINQEFYEQIDSIKGFFEQNKEAYKELNWAKSYNITLELSKNLGSEEIEEVKNTVLEGEEFKRPKILTSTFGLTPSPINLKFFGLSNPSLSKDFFLRLSQNLGVTVIVINLTKKNRYVYEVLKKYDDLINNESILRNINIFNADGIKSVEPLDLIDDGIKSTDDEPINSESIDSRSINTKSIDSESDYLSWGELEYFDYQNNLGYLNNSSYPNNSNSPKNKYIVLKVLTPDIVFVMTRHSANQFIDSNKLGGPSDCVVSILESNRVKTYNKIIEVEFLKRDVVKKQKLINIPQFIPISQLVYKIKVEASKVPISGQIKVIMNVVQKQIKEIFALNIYEYISLYEGLGTKLVTAYGGIKKNTISNEDILTTVLAEVFPHSRNIFLEIRDNLTDGEE